MADDVGAGAGTRTGEAEQEPSTSYAPSQGRAVMAVLFLVFFLGLSDNQMVSPLLPLIAAEFGLEAGEVGKLLGPSYALAAACAALLIGPTSDRFGRRRFLLYAAILFGSSLLAVFVVGDVHLLAGVRFLTGLAAGTFSTCSIAYVGDYFPYERRGTAMSIVQSGYFAALVFGVSLGSMLAQWRGWRVSFMAFGLLSLVAFGLMLALLPDDSNLVAEHSSAIIARRFDNIRIVFDNRERIASIAAAFFVSGGFMGFILYIGSWLTRSFGLLPGTVGSVFVVVGIASLAGALAAGPLADRFGKRGLSIISTLLLATMLVLIPKLGWGSTLFAGFLVAALAFAFRQGPLQALATELVPRRARGALVAARNTASQIGIAVSSVAGGYLYDGYGYSAVGFFSATMTLAAALCIVLMKEPQQKEGS